MKDIVTAPHAELVKESEVPSLLKDIRPQWRAKDLIQRVKRLIPVDPSSACQRLFNASIHDLKEKIILAGLDIAKETANNHKLPPIENQENIESYSTANLIDLTYRIGIISRPEWRRLLRCYEIRRDLEHEDDEYEAGVEDCIYIFKTCIDVVLSRDPIDLLRVKDVKELIEEPQPATPSTNLLEEYENAPQSRQEEILKFLVSIALNEEQADVVRQNATRFLGWFSRITQNTTKLSIAKHVQEKIKRKGPSWFIIRISYVAGVLGYLKKAHLTDFFSSYNKSLWEIHYGWNAHNSHGEILRSLIEVGGLLYCPQKIRIKILKWLVLAYVGEKGGKTSWGNVRHVYYSNTAAPLVEKIIEESADIIKDDLIKLKSDKNIKEALYTKHIERRMENLIDIVSNK